MEDYKQIFYKVLERSDVKGELADKLVERLMNSLYATYVDELLKTNYSDEERKMKLEEYGKLTAEGRQGEVDAEVQKMSGELGRGGIIFGSLFGKHLRYMVENLKIEKKMDEAKYNELMSYCNTLLADMKEKCLEMPVPGQDSVDSNQEIIL